MVTTQRMAWGAWLVASVFYGYQYILRVMPNIILPDIMAKFQIDTVIFGQFAGAYYIGYCLMHIPIGILLDRYGPRKVMSLSILLTAGGLLPILSSGHWIFPVLGRGVTGAGSAAAILGTFKIIRMVYPEHRFTKMLSLSVTIGLIGALYGGVPVGSLCTLYGFKAVIIMCILIGVGLAGLIYFLAPEMKTEPTTPVVADLKTVFKTGKVLWVSCFAGLMVGPMEGFADAWGAEFLQKVYILTPQTAQSVTSLIFLGMCFAPLLSRLGEKIGNDQTTIGAGGLMLFFFTLLIGSWVAVKWMPFIFFLVGVCCAYQVLALYKVSTYVPERVAGLTTAVANMILMSFGYMFHSIIGVSVQAYSSLGPEASFKYGVSIIPIALFLGVAGFMGIFWQERQGRLREQRPF